MDELTRFLNGPECAALGQALLHSLWQGAAIAGLLAVVNWRLAARARYGAACAALAVLLVSVGLTTVICYDAPRAASWVPARLAAIPAGGDAFGVPDAARGGFEWMLWLAPLWAAGVMLMSFRLAVGWLGARRLVRLAGPALPARWQQVAQALATKLGVRGKFRLLESVRIAGPAVIGWLRPAILVPTGALCGLSAGQLEAVLAHELAHLARRDALVNLVESVAEVLLFYHPAFWWISARIRRERECCCDDLAVAVCGSARLYAEALLRLEEARPARGALVFAARDGDLASRVRRLLYPTAAERLEWRGALPVLAGLVVVAIVAAALTLQATPAAPLTVSVPGAAVAEALLASQSASNPPVATPYRKWLEEDAAYIIQDWERREAAGLKTDAEWERFIEQFWRRRNPNPEKRENLLKEEHYRRISYANQRYGEASTPGWRTERGRLYISYGPPDEITVLGGYEKWFYRLIAGVGSNVSFEFGLDRKPSESQAQQEAMRYLEQLLRQSEQIDRAAQERTKALQNVELQKRDLERVQEEIQRVQAELARLKAEQAAKQR